MKNTICHWTWWNKPCWVNPWFEVKDLKINWGKTTCPHPSCPYQVARTEDAVTVVLHMYPDWTERTTVLRNT